MMNKEQRLEVFKALGEGKTVRMQRPDRTWFEVSPDSSFGIEHAVDFAVPEPVVIESNATARALQGMNFPVIILSVAPKHYGKRFHVVATELIDGALSQPKDDTPEQEPEFAFEIRATRIGERCYVYVRVPDDSEGKLFNVKATRLPG